jgi:Ser/Thr protein kinase RdoA (MazF antagonist)
MFTEKILRKAVEQYGDNYLNGRLLGGFSNNVYEVVLGGEAFVLKLVPFSAEKETSIERELHWVEYLAKNGMSVSYPLPSLRGKFIEQIEIEGSPYLTTLYVKVSGKLVNNKDSSEWNEDLFTKWGEAMGKMHSLSKSYDSTEKRDANYSCGNETLSQTTLSVSTDVQIRWNRFYNELRQLPKDRESYGVIHNDLHQENFYIHNGELILFDFGDFEYNWFAYDIAISLYHAIQSITSGNEEERKGFAYRFIDAFMKGYRSKNVLDDFWVKKIPCFLNFRQVFSYVYFNNHLDINSFNSNQKQALATMKYKIEHDIPYVEDFIL